MSDKIEMDKSEEKGYYLLTLSRGPFYISMLVILLPVVLDLAKFHRGSDAKIAFGALRVTPSAFVFAINSLTSFLVILLSPLIGALADINNYRKKMITYFSVLFLAINFSSLVLLFRSTWLFAGFVQLTTVAIFELTNVIFNAFMAETGKTEEDFNRLSSFSTVFENGSILLFLIFLPLILQSSASRNLITHGNFDYYKSYSSWDLLFDSRNSKCSDQEVARRDVPACWTSVKVGSNGLHDLSVYLPAGESVQLSQETDITKREHNMYSFSSIMYSENEADEINAQLVVRQFDVDNVLIKMDMGQNLRLRGVSRLYQQRFYLVENVSRATFLILFSSGNGGTAKIDKIETVMPLDSRQIIILIISAILFSGLSIYALCFFKDRENESALTASDAFANSLRDLRHALKESLGQKRTSIFLLSNMLWYGGYIILSLLMIIYLEDVHSLGSFNLSLLFILICFSVMVGAIMNYFLKKCVDIWITALVFYGIWIVLPFLIFTKQLNLPLYVNIIFFVISGICFGMIESIKFSIYASLIPKKEEGKYMGFFLLSIRLMNLLCNLVVLLIIKFIKFETIIALTSILFAASFGLILLLVVRKIENKPTGDELSIIANRISLD